MFLPSNCFPHTSHFFGPGLALAGSPPSVDDDVVEAVDPAEVTVAEGTAPTVLELLFDKGEALLRLASLTGVVGRERMPSREPSL